MGERKENVSKHAKKNTKKEIKKKYTVKEEKSFRHAYICEDL